MKKRLLFVGILFLLYNCEAIFVEDISENAVVLLAPTNNSVITSGTIVFNWQEIVDASEYEVQIARPSFESATQILLDSLATITTLSKELAVGDYQWRVRALNSEYNTDFGTHSFSVIDANFENKIIPLVLPIDKDTTNVKNQTLVWQAIESAKEYRIQVWQPDIDGTKIEDTSVTNTNYEYEFPEGDFTWQVRGETISKNTVFSSRTITVDTTAPNTPTLDLPTDNATIAATTSTTFKWNRTDIVGTPELDSIYFYSEVTLQNLVHKNRGITKEYTKNDFSTGDYYWFVKSFDKAGNDSTSSTTRKLTIN